VSLCAGSLASADRKLAELVMPEPKLLAGLNMDRVKSTATGRFVLKQIAERTKQLQSMTSYYGVDATRIQELVIASTSMSPADGGLALVRAKFNAAEIRNRAARQGAIEETYGNTTILENASQTMALAFFGKDIAAAGDVASVKGAIDRNAGSPALPQPLVDEVGRWSSTEDIWAISTNPEAALAAATKLAVPPGMLSRMRDAAGGLKLLPKSAVLTAQAQTDAPETAAALGMALKMLATMAQKTAEKNGTPPAIPMPTVGSEGPMLKVSANLSDVELRTLLAPQQVKTAKKK
jgi:hypothetical protein